MSMTMEQAVAQLQQEVFTLRAPVAAESGLADAVRAVNNLANAQAQEDTPSLIDVKGLGRPKESSGIEEHFQQWSKKTETFSAGVVKESQMMLGWAAEQATEITQEAVDLEFLPTVTNAARWSTKPGVRAAAEAHSTYGAHESRSERQCRQLAEEPVGGLAKTAEALRSYDRR